MLGSRFQDYVQDTAHSVHAILHEYHEPVLPTRDPAGASRLPVTG